MTNNIKFASMNFPARVEYYDNGSKTESRIVLQEDADSFQCYATTTREVRIIDLTEDHSDVIAERAKRQPTTPAPAAA